MFENIFVFDEDECYYVLWGRERVKEGKFFLEVCLMNGLCGLVF